LFFLFPQVDCFQLSPRLAISEFPQVCFCCFCCCSVVLLMSQHRHCSCCCGIGIIVVDAAVLIPPSLACLLPTSVFLLSHISIFVVFVDVMAAFLFLFLLMSRQCFYFCSCHTIVCFCCCSSVVFVLPAAQVNCWFFSSLGKVHFCYCIFSGRSLIVVFIFIFSQVDCF